MIRVREFYDEDAYSFHTSQEDLDAVLSEMHEAYHAFFDALEPEVWLLLRMPE